MTITDQYDEYLAHLLRGERTDCARIVRELLDAGVGIKTLYSDLFGATLCQVGELWQANRISVATEHLATAVTENVMSQVVAPTLFGHEPTGRSMIVTCVANEFHQIGGRMVADIAEMKGWDTWYLGANTPLPGLLAMIDEKHPDVVAFSTAVYFNLPNLRSAIEALKMRHPQTPIWLGGQMFRRGGSELEEQYSLVKRFTSLDEFEGALECLAAGKTLQ